MNQTCPDFLKNKRILSLDVGLLMAGAKERGELETRVTNLLKEAKEANGEVILMIDEMHILVGAGTTGRGGSGGGGLDIANLFKPVCKRPFFVVCLSKKLLQAYTVRGEMGPSYIHNMFSIVLCNISNHVI